MTAFVQLPDQTWAFCADLPDNSRIRESQLLLLRGRFRRVTVCEHDPATGRNVPRERLLGMDNPGQEREE